MPELRLEQRSDAEKGVQLMRESYADAPGSEFVGAWLAFYGGEQYSVLVTRDNLTPEPTQVPDVRWHISIAAQHGVPPWKVLAAIAHEVRPGVAFALGIPPRSWWVNVHPGTLHLYELRDQALIDQWRFERQGHAPT